jgi:hypothetical protein
MSLSAPAPGQLVTVRQRQLGLTRLYGLLHDPEYHAPDIDRLRQLYVQLNQGVLSAYSWEDLPREPHDFYETPLGVRFTLKPTATAEMLDRLLEFNHQRYAEEVKQGLHDTASKGKKKPAKKAPSKSASRPRKSESARAHRSAQVLLSLLVSLGGCKAHRAEPPAQAAPPAQAPATEDSRGERWVEVADFDCAPLAEEGDTSFRSMRQWASGGPAGATWNAETLTCHGRVSTTCTQGTVLVELLTGSRRAASQRFPAAELPTRVEFTVSRDAWSESLDETFEHDIYRTALLRLRASLRCEEPFLAGPGFARHEDVVAEDRFVAGFASGE